MNAARSRFLARWYYTRHFLAELGPIAACIFVIVSIVWASAIVGWIVSCGLTLGYAPWCQ